MRFVLRLGPVLRDPSIIYPTGLIASADLSGCLVYGARAVLSVGSVRRGVAALPYSRGRAAADVLVAVSVCRVVLFRFAGP